MQKDAEALHPAAWRKKLNKTISGESVGMWVRAERVKNEGARKEREKEDWGRGGEEGGKTGSWPDFNIKPGRSGAARTQLNAASSLRSANIQLLCSYSMKTTDTNAQKLDQRGIRASVRDVQSFIWSSLRLNYMNSLCLTTWSICSCMVTFS